MSKSVPSREEIWKMFDTIAQTYDRANRWMTFGLDLYWRKRLARFLPQGSSLSLLDCATGTGDQLLTLLKHSSSISQAIGTDLSEEMLHIARGKVEKTPFASSVSFQKADLLALPFEDHSFDCVSLSFGIRNVTDVPKALQEIRRVLKPGGRALILETSLPKQRGIRNLHLFYLRHLLPLIGGMISKKKNAYKYLNQTTETFVCGDEFCHLLHHAGFCSATSHPMTLGSVSLYVADA